MQFILYISIGIICVGFIIAVIWRFSSRRASIPCPSWLGWLVELDNPIFRNNRASEIISHLGLCPEMKVLDFGCGPGRLTIPVAKQIGSSGMVTAFDIQAAMLERVQKKAVQENIGNIEFVHGGAGEGKLRNNYYDRALLVTVLGEIPEKNTLMKEIFDCLKSGGLLSVTEAIADPHFQKREKVVSVAKTAGFIEKDCFGHRFSYTMILEKTLSRLIPARRQRLTCAACSDTWLVSLPLKHLFFQETKRIEHWQVYLLFVSEHSYRKEISMKKVGKILIWVVLLIVCIIGFLIGKIILISRPTQGNKIAQYENPQQAVLVIDIQEDFTGTTAKPPFPYKDSQKLITAVNAITAAASSKNINIIYIQQVLDGFWGRILSKLFAGGTVIKGNPGTEIDKRITMMSSHVFPKPKSDAFSNPKLEEFLIANQVNELYLVGLDADGCLHATAQGALNRGYKVNIITDAIVLREIEKWDSLLKQYQQEGIQLMLTQEFLNGSL